jgi:Tfp pilus assembly protein PilV
MGNHRLGSAAGGFSLVEAIVALAILSVGVLSLAQLFPLSTMANMSARHATYAAVLAGTKVEELRALAWRFDHRGAPVSDPILHAAEGTDYVDRYGNQIDAGSEASHDAAIYARHWTIEPLATDPANSLIIQVRVHPRRGAATDANTLIRVPGETRVVTLRRRAAP